MWGIKSLLGKKIASVLYDNFAVLVYFSVDCPRGLRHPSLHIESQEEC